MDSFDAFEDREFEQLNDAILKAIISSRDVGKVLEDFKAKELINEMAVVNLSLSLEELSGLMSPDSSGKEAHSLETFKKSQPDTKKITENLAPENASKKNSCESSSNYLVDGKLLSRNEIPFERYYQGRFNEKQWLKRAKIQL